MSDEFEYDTSMIEMFIERANLSDEAADRMRDHGRHWILLDGEPVVVGLMEWAEWLQNGGRHIVAQDEVVTDSGSFQVSTVFMGIDYSFGDGPTPMLFETMIFKRLGDDERETAGCERHYPTLELAELGHARAIADLLEGNLDD